MEKLTNQQYRFICELLWGGSPVDKVWAEGTRMFKDNAEKIRKTYPQLDKSFFEKSITS